MPRFNHLRYLIIPLFLSPLLFVQGNKTSQNSASKTPITKTIEKTIGPVEIQFAEYKADGEGSRQNSSSSLGTGTLQSGSHTDWMSQAGIPSSVWGYVELLVARESGWNPNAINRSSGACGLGQQLPCGKWPHTWNDPVGGLIDANSYVIGRYGSWANAWSHSQQVNWY